jgi:hypothetical protein
VSDAAASARKHCSGAQTGQRDRCTQGTGDLRTGARQATVVVPVRPVIVITALVVTTLVVIAALVVIATVVRTVRRLLAGVL